MDKNQTIYSTLYKKFNPFSSKGNLHFSAKASIIEKDLSLIIISMSQELLQEMIQTGLQAIKENRENKKSEEKEVKNTVKSALLTQKQEIAREYIEKKINDPILQLTWVAENYLITDGLFDKIKDKFIFENFLEKSNLEINTLKDIKTLKIDLEKATTEDELNKIRNMFLKENNQEVVVVISKPEESKQWKQCFRKRRKPFWYPSKLYQQNISKICWTKKMKYYKVLTNGYSRSIKTYGNKKSYTKNICSNKQRILTKA